MTSTLDTAVERLHGLIVTARHENPGTSADPYLDALNLWTAVIPAVREVLGTLQVHGDTLGEVEYLFRESVTAWLRGDEPSSVLTDDHGTAALLDDNELEHKIRMALNPPADLIF